MKDDGKKLVMRDATIHKVDGCGFRRRSSGANQT
jgi:hypothetical protein